MTSTLFSPVTLPAPEGPGLSLRNRALVSPMCQYSVEARDGAPTDWHLVHLGAFATGGFGLVTAEATAVEARGRISSQDLGLWEDGQIAAHRRVVDFVHAHGAAAGVQLAHAGGKASTHPALPDAGQGTASVAEGGWQTVGATDAPVLPDLDAPRALTAEEIAETVAAWADAARRADEAGYDVIQIHAAHGYLLHQFLSPLNNTRTDAYGGDEAARSRLLLEVVDAVRAVWPAHKPLGVRLSGTDWVTSSSWDAEAAARVADVLVRSHGVGWIDVSSGGLGGGAQIPVGPGYQVPLAAAVSRAVEGTGAVVSAVGMITSAQQAETVLVADAAQAISIGRAALRNPHWAAVAAQELHVPRTANPIAGQYWRGGW